MALRYAAERDKAGVILQLTSLTVEEFETLAPAVQDAFLAYTDDWTLEGLPRTGRRYSQYATCPLPTPHDRLLFVLMYLKTAPRQSAHAAAFGLTQPKANRWLHILLRALRTALRQQGYTPSRTIAALTERLATLTMPDQRDARATESPPFFGTMAPNDRSHDQPIRLSKPTTRAARKSVMS